MCLYVCVCVACVVNGYCYLCVCRMCAFGRVKNIRSSFWSCLISYKYKYVLHIMWGLVGRRRKVGGNEKLMILVLNSRIFLQTMGKF